MTPPNREDLLAAVERSPQAFTVHDRDGWVGVFSDNARVEDPVGSSPHVGYDQIYSFYDTFIGPRDIKFHRDLDIVNGHTVVRDLELEVAMGSAVTMYIPAFLRYDLREVNGEWKVASLRAYWELPAMMWQFLRTGMGAAPPGLQLFKGLLTNQGLRGTAGFMTGFRRVGRRHKKLVDTFLGSVTRGDKHGALRALGLVLDQVEDERPADALAVEVTAVEAQMVEHGNVVVGVGVPIILRAHRGARLAARIALVHRDDAVV